MATQDSMATTVILDLGHMASNTLAAAPLDFAGAPLDALEGGTVGVEDLELGVLRVGGEMQPVKRLARAVSLSPWRQVLTPNSSSSLAVLKVRRSARVSFTE